MSPVSPSIPEIPASPYQEIKLSLLHTTLATFKGGVFHS